MNTALPEQPQSEVSVDRRLQAASSPGRRALVVSVMLGLGLSVTLIAQAILLAHLLGWVMATQPGAFPTSILAWLLITFLVRALLVAFSDVLAAQSGRRVSGALRQELFAAFDALGPIGLNDKKTGAMALNATHGIRSLQPYFSRYLPAAVVAVFAPPLAFAALGIIDWPSALIVLVLVCIVPFAMIRFGRSAAKESERQWRRLSSLSGRILELLRGLPTLRALGQVEHGRLEVESASEAVAESVTATLRAAMFSTAALEFLAGVGVGLVAMLAGLRLLHGSISVVAALTVILLAPEVFLPLRRAGAEFHASTEGRAAAQSIFATIDAAPQKLEETATLEKATPMVASNLTASYRSSDTEALTACSFTLKANEHLVISGPSGSGKSTLLDVIAGFLAPSSGSLTIDGVEVTQLTSEQFAEYISYVPQSPHVFAGTLTENLTLGLDCNEASLINALQLVGLSHLVDANHGFGRILAEHGHSISGGERQRLGLARAILQNRPVVLLDEPTAHLDDLTSNALRESLAPWLAERTVIEVTHRPGLITDGQRLDLRAVEGSS